jgi:hypothetical protein
VAIAPGDGGKLCGLGKCRCGQVRPNITRQQLSAGRDMDKAFLSLTRCTMMQEPELPMRPLQNHLPLDKHFTTAAGLHTPQYLQQRQCATHCWLWSQPCGLGRRSKPAVMQLQQGLLCCCADRLLV